VTLDLAAATYRYPGAEHPSLHAIDLVIRPGETVGVVGANESGKSTLALVCSGLAPGTVGGELHGRVTIDGTATAGAAPSDLAQRCGILLQDPGTQLSRTTRTVFEEIAFGPSNLGVPLGEVIERVEEALDALRIRDLAPRDPARLSGGQGQLVALASVMAMRPPYLVLDEPTSQLDPQGTHLVGDALRRLAATGAGLLLAEQKTEILADVCERVIVLDRGRIVADGPTGVVLGDQRLESWGVEPPASVRVARLLAAAGLDPAVARSA
jgi:energy-coupling factor transporter ATP-binding protein EcfA2